MKPASYTPAYGLLEVDPQPFATTHVATGPFTGPGNYNPSNRRNVA
jgi:hypothetical protein